MTNLDRLDAPRTLAEGLAGRRARSSSIRRFITHSRRVSKGEAPMDRAYLEYRDGYSDKFYRIVVTEVGGDWITTVWWGRRGSDGQTQVKYMGPSKATAQAELAKLYAQKTGKGYVDAVDPVSPAATIRVTVKTPGRTITFPASTGVGVPRFPAMKAREIEDPWRRIAYDGSFVMEEKFDGHRAGLAFNPDGTIVIRNVDGNDKGRIENAPHIEYALRVMAAAAPDDLFQGTLIDGELVGLTIEETAHLLGSAGKNDPRLRFVAFDLPFLAGKDLRSEPWQLRRNLLLGLVLDEKASPVKITQVWDPDPAIVQAIWDRGGEGAIIKPIESPYIPGSRNYWIKVKEKHSTEAVISGYEMGNGKYANQVGALILSQFKGGYFKEVCKLSGMSDAQRRDMTDNWHNWLDYVVEFEYQKKTANSYRHPRFIRMRPDKEPRDCTWEASP